MSDEQISIAERGFVWHELMSTDPQQSEDFYLKVTGAAVFPVGQKSDEYQMIAIDGQPVGGIAGPRSDREGWPSGGPDAHWIAYFGTSDADAAARTAEELGGAVLLPPTDVPGMGRAAVLRDPQGAAFGVFAPAS
jgi:uncharacterized protein